MEQRDNTSERRQDGEDSTYNKPVVTDYGKIVPRLAFSPPAPPGGKTLEVPDGAKGPP